MKTNIVKCIFTVTAVLAVTLTIGAGAASAQGNTPDGTVKDGGLVWLKNANCFGTPTWNQAKNYAVSLKSGSCGLNDGSTAGQWRLPTKNELLHRRQNTQEFYNVMNGAYWTSETFTVGSAWAILMTNGFAYEPSIDKLEFVWPVRNK